MDTPKFQEEEKKKSHRHRPRFRDRPRHKRSSISESSSELSESSSSRIELHLHLTYEMFRKPSRGLLQRAFSQLNQDNEDLAPQRAGESVISALESSFCFVKTNIHEQTRCGASE